MSKTWDFVRWMSLGLALPALLFGAGPAFAGLASFDVPPAATSAAGSGVIIGSTIGLSPSGRGGFNMGFVLPKGYKKNEPIRVVFYMQTPAPGCDARFSVLSLQRKRLGHPLAAGLSGLTPLQGSPVRTMPANGKFKPVAFEIAPDNSLRGQKPGDAIALLLFREGDDPADTCEQNIYIHAINVIYPTG